MASKVILVTGANRGIGFAIVQALAERSSDLTLLVAARDRSNSHDAIRQLRDLGLKADFRPAQLDVSEDDSIQDLASEVQQQFGKLDVLINNAGIAGGTIQGTSNFREIYNQILDINVTSVGLVSTLFLPLLLGADDPRVINVSSARGSLARVTSGDNPATSKVPYSVSKAALNLLTVEMSNANPGIQFQATNPGWCKTGLNGFRGPKDPLEGALPAVELALADRGKYKPGFWEYEEGEMRVVPW